MPWRDERGMTLLEAVVALTIVASAGIAALATVGSQLRASDRARQAVEAAALADERMARVGLLAASDLSPLPDSLRAGTFPGPLGDYAWTVASRPLLGEQDTYAVTVTVIWPERGRYALETRWYRPAGRERTP
jgi:type II secretory pathway pseudopilin PulG